MCYLIGNPTDVRLGVCRDRAHFVCSQSPFLFFLPVKRLSRLNFGPFKENRDNVLNSVSLEVCLLNNHRNKVLFLVRSPNT